MHITSVYRLQLTPQFTFAEATAIVPYLHELGIDAVYASPIFEARPGSRHGYDTTDPRVIRRELGGKEGFDAFVAMLHECNMGLILDIVANHMAASEYNPWWVDVLTHGRASHYAHFFDIDWNSEGKVYLPILEAPLMHELEAGKIRLLRVGDHCQIEAGWQRLPLSPESESGITDPVAYNIAGSKLMKHLLEQQHYRLVFWQSGPQNSNYRRFFDINELPAVRVEEEDVFSAFHEAVFPLIKEGSVQGVRVDHPDGFWEPKVFFKRLREGGAPHVIVEKILERGESLPKNWDVDGSVGYEFLTLLSGLFVDSGNEAFFDELYTSYIGKKIDPQELLFEQKRLFALISMRSEVQMLTRRLYATIEKPLFSLNDLQEGIVDLLAAFPVYRTYVGSDDKELVSEDRCVIEEAFGNMETYAAAQSEVVSYLKQWLNLEVGARDEILRFQQLSAPIMAKGFEDTHLYVYNRFIALNEVGGDPHSFGRSIEEFHKANKEGRRGFLPLSTHDTKRSCDVRMRLAALSVMPKKWKERIEVWTGIVPEFDRNVLYFFFQTIVGMWPVEPLSEEEHILVVQRLCDYLVKASREAKVHTNWINHNDQFEHALTSFARRVMSSQPFMDEFLPFLTEVNRYGMRNTYSALVLALGSPGVVDVYQGSELWDYSLVDPDNRREVDFAHRHNVLSEVKHIRDLDMWLDGRLTRISHTHGLKCFVLWKGLQCRRTYPDLFTSGEYIPLECASHVVAYMRKSGKHRAVIIALRWHTKALKGTKLLLPEALTLENIFTGEHVEGAELSCDAVCGTLPCAIFIGSSIQKAAPHPVAGGDLAP